MSAGGYRTDSSATSGVYPNGSGLSSSTVLSSDAVRYTETVSGVTRRKPRGWVAPTAYSLSIVYYRRAQGWYLNQGQSAFGWNRSSGALGGGSGWNSLNHFNEIILEANVSDASLANKALIAARLKVKGTSVNLGVAFGERKQTAKLVGDTANRIVRSVRDLKRGKIRSAMSHLGITSKARQPRGQNWTQNWLELQYGWKPLLSDVYGACDALSKRNKSDWRVTAKASRESPIDVVRAAPALASRNVGSYSGRAKGKCSVFVRLDLLPANEATISLASSGVTNPLLIGWELVPFSFVVDWFWPVGDYIDSLDAMLGYSSGSGSSSYLRECEWWADGVDGRWPATSSYNGLKQSWSEYKRMKVLSRTVISPFTIPSIPRFKDPASLTHMANGLSLLAQVFGRPARKFTVR